MEGLTIPTDVEVICSRLRTLLEKAVERHLSEGILLSGGLDTSILASIATRSVSLKAFTVAFEGAPAPDLKYADLIACRLGLEHVTHIFDKDELFDTIPIVVKATRSFDPMEIRNSIPIYIGLKLAKENGIRTVMTGDGSDELLAGYSFLFGFEKERLDFELRKLSSAMTFSSTALAAVLRMNVRLPFLDREFKAFASNLDSRCKIRSERGQLYGKWILRKAYEEILPAEIIWRTKTPIEQGSGTAILPSLFEERIPNTEFLEKRRKYLCEDNVTIRDKEQLFYYESYRKVVGVPQATNKEGKGCPACHCTIDVRATYCKTCGAYPL